MSAEPEPSGLRSVLRQRWPRRGSYSADVVQTFVVNLLGAGLGFLSGMLLARFLGADGRGQLAAVQAMPMIVASIGMLGLQDAIIYFGARDKKNIGQYAVSATTLIGLAGLPIVVISALVLPLFLRQQQPHVVFGSQVYLGLLFVFALNGLSLCSARAAHNMPLWNALRIGPPAIWVVVIAVSFLTGWIGPVQLAWTYLVALGAFALVATVTVRRYFTGGWRVRTSLWPPMLRYGLPLAAGGTPQVLNERIDQLLVAGMLAERELGYYAVAVSWSLLATLAGTAVYAVAFSKIAGMQDARAQLAFIKKATLALVVLSAAAGLALVLPAPILIPLVFTADFEGAVPLAMILVLAACIRNVARMFQFSMQGVGRPMAVMVSEWAGFGVLVLTALPLIRHYGARGAAWAVVASGATAMIVAGVSIAAWARGVERSPSGG